MDKPLTPSFSSDNPYKKRPYQNISGYDNTKTRQTNAKSGRTVSTIGSKNTRTHTHDTRSARSALENGHPVRNVSTRGTPPFCNIDNNPPEQPLSEQQPSGQTFEQQPQSNVSYSIIVFPDDVSLLSDYEHVMLKLESTTESNDPEQLEYVAFINQQEQNLKKTLRNQFEKTHHSLFQKLKTLEFEIPRYNIIKITEAIKLFCKIGYNIVPNMYNTTHNTLFRVTTIFFIEQSLEDLTEISKLKTINSIITITRNKGFILLEDAKRFDQLTFGENKNPVRENQNMLNLTVAIMRQQALNTKNIDSLQKFFDQLEKLPSEMFTAYKKVFSAKGVPDRIYTKQELEKILIEQKSIKESINKNNNILKIKLLH